MDDRDLEIRLRTRLHNRFDDARVPPDLARNVSQAMAAPASRVDPFDLRVRPVRLGWSLVAAAVVVAVGAVSVGKLGGPIGPGAPPSSSPVATAAPERYFVVLPPPGPEIGKPVSGLASDILNARMVALGVGNFTTGVGYEMQFRVPAEGPSDVAIRRVLEAAGDVRLVPLPPADYGVGTVEAVVGEPLPKDEPALFGWEGITSIAIDSTGVHPALEITLKPAAQAAFADYTASHTGEYFAIVVDGLVALLPVINEPIEGPQIQVSSGGDEPDPFAETSAILVGGMLPEAWRGASVPILISAEVAAAAALTATHSDTIEYVGGPSVGDLGPLAALRVWWDVQVAAPRCQPSQPCPSAASLLVQVDAVTGEVFHVGNLEP